MGLSADAVVLAAGPDPLQFATVFWPNRRSALEAPTALRPAAATKSMKVLFDAAWHWPAPRAGRTMARHRLELPLPTHRKFPPQFSHFSGADTRAGQSAVSVTEPCAQVTADVEPIGGSIDTVHAEPARGRARKKRTISAEASGPAPSV